MKKSIIKLIAIALSLVTIFAFTACAEIENNSKIQRMKIELSYQDAEGEEVITTDVYVKLYLNLAPVTTQHFITLAEEGYYNGVTVSNVSANWLEFGGYKYDESGNLVENAYTKDPIVGEFAKNGWVGNTTAVTKGALVMKRDYDDATNQTRDSKYDTAEGTVILCLTSSASSTFNKEKYCVFGVVVSDDATSEEDDATLEEKSSIDKCVTLADYAKKTDDDGNTVTTYYYEKTSTFYTKWTDEANEAHYVEGTSIDGEEILGDELEELKELMNDEKNYFLVIPYVQITIKSITKV